MHNSTNNPFLLPLFDAMSALKLSLFKPLKLLLMLLRFELVQSFLVLVF